LIEPETWQFVLVDAISISDGSSTARTIRDVGTYAGSTCGDSRSFALPSILNHFAIFITEH